MKRSKIRVLSIILALAFVITGCGGGGTAKKDEANKEQTAKVIKTNNGSEPGALDPALATGTHESWILEHIFEGLMKYDKDGQLVSGVAEKYEESEDKTKYIFHLRDSKWSDGKPVTAEDFEYAWKRVLNPETAASYANQLYYIQGGEEYNTGKGSADDVKVKATDEKTLEVELNAPTSYFLELLADKTFAPVQKELVESNKDWAKDAKTHVSNGPFKLTKWEHRSKIDIEKNDEYYNADEIKLSAIQYDIIEDKNTEWQKFEGGELNYIVDPQTDTAAKLIKNKDPRINVSDMVGTYYLNLNTEVKPLDNVKVRQALSMAIDRQSIVDNVVQGGQKTASGIVPYGIFDETGKKEFRDTAEDLIVEDVSKAKELLKEGLEETGMTAEDFSKMTILYNTDETHKKVMQAVQEMWKQNLGIDVQLENAEFQVKLDREKAGDYQISRAGWLGDYLDPTTMMDLWLIDGPFNDANWTNEEYDKLVKDAMVSPDAKKRMDEFREAEKIIMNEMPIIPIYFYNQAQVSDASIKGVVNTAQNYPSFIYADIVE